MISSETPREPLRAEAGPKTINTAKSPVMSPSTLEEGKRKQLAQVGDTQISLQTYLDRLEMFIR